MELCQHVHIVTDTFSSSDHSLPSSGSAPCMFGVPSPFASQETLLPQQRVASSSDVQDLVSSLPPINTVFMGTGGVQWRWSTNFSCRMFCCDLCSPVSSRTTRILNVCMQQYDWIVWVKTGTVERVRGGKSHRATWLNSNTIRASAKPPGGRSCVTPD